MQYPSLRALCAWFLPCALTVGCAVSSVSDESDLPFYEDAGPSSSVTTSPPSDDEPTDASVLDLPSSLDAAAFVDAGGPASDAGGAPADGSSPADAGSDAGNSARDAGAQADAGRDASTPVDAGGDAGNGGGSCVASQCSITCFTAPCCNAFDQCACQDLIGLCILPGI